MPGAKWSDVPDLDDTFDRRWMAAIEERLLYEEHTRAALARALVLVDAIPNEAFDTLVSPETRKDWKRYFDWLGRSELF